jgi:hypothetical protein
MAARPSELPAADAAAPFGFRIPDQYTAYELQGRFAYAC